MKWIKEKKENEKTKYKENSTEEDIIKTNSSWWDEIKK